MRRWWMSLLLLLPVLSPQRTANLDPVVQRAAVYVASYEEKFAGITATEDFDESVTRLHPASPEDAKSERELASDIIWFHDGGEWFPVRCIRTVDFKDNRRVEHDRVTIDQDSYARKDSIAALGPRTRPSPLRRNLNLPGIALAVLHESNAGLYSYRKAGEEKIGGVTMWRLAFEQKQPLAGYDPLAVTLWVDPANGQVWRSLIEERGTAAEDAHRSRVEVKYAQNARFGVVAPASMHEHYEDASETIDGSAQYEYIRRAGAAVAAPTASASGTAAGEVQPGGFKLVVDVPLISLDVSVGGGRGGVTNLTASDFSIFENGEPQSIAHFTPVSVPYDVLLLFDWSGSMTDKRPLLVQAAQALIGRLRSQDWVGIGRFSTELEMEGWTGSRVEAARRVAELRSPLHNQTNLFSSMESALVETLPFVGRRRAMVVLTDGRDNAFEEADMAPRIGKAVAPNRPGLPPIASDVEKGRFNRLLEIVRQERIPVYMVVFHTPVEFPDPFPGMDRVRDEFEAELHRRMGALAEASGGKALFAERFEDIVPLYNQIGRDLGSAYTLGYYSTIPTTPGVRTIIVKTKDPSLQVIQSRAGYEIPKP